MFGIVVVGRNLEEFVSLTSLAENVSACWKSRPKRDFPKPFDKKRGKAYKMDPC